MTNCIEIVWQPLPTMAWQQYTPGLVMAAVIFIIGSAIVGSVLSAKKRREALEQLAQEQGYEFDKHATLCDWATDTKDFSLFNKGRSKKARNSLTKTIEDIEVSIFNYQFTTGSGKNSSTTAQTVAVLECPGMNLPAFKVEPEHFMHRLGTMMGMQDIDFDDNPEFSKKFRLTGESEAAIRERFDSTLMDYFLRHPKLSLEARRNRFLVYQFGKTQPIKNYQAFLDSAMEPVLMLMNR